MKKELSKKELDGIAKNMLFIKSLEVRNSDGLDFYDNEDGSISVRDLKDTLNYAYDLGHKDANKVTKIKLAYDLGFIEVGRKVILFNKKYTVVGIDGDNTVFACLNPKNLEDAKVQILCEEDIKEFIEEGCLKGFKSLRK